MYAHDYDRFLLSLFIPPDRRELFLGVYALNVALLGIRGLVSEEMIGHIRHAWWQEVIEGLYAGGVPRGQPVLEALAPHVAAGLIPRELLMLLLQYHREHFPGAPPELDEMMKELSLALIRSLCPHSEAPWLHAREIIRRHRLRHGCRWNGWLSLKLLCSGAPRPARSAAA